MASSSHLSHFIELKNKTVWLRENNSKTKKTKLTLYAVNFDRKKVLLELSKINRLILQYISDPKHYSNFTGEIKMEQRFANGYKADLVIHKPQRTTIIEAKALLTYDALAAFPTVTVNRATRQLSQIKELLLQGYEIYYWLVLLNPKSEAVTMNKEESAFYALFQECLALGMQPVVSSVVWKNTKGFMLENVKSLKFS